MSNRFSASQNGACAESAGTHGSISQCLTDWPAWLWLEDVCDMCNADYSVMGDVVFVGKILTLSNISLKAKHASAKISDPWNEVGNDLIQCSYSVSAQVKLCSKKLITSKKEWLNHLHILKSLCARINTVRERLSYTVLIVWSMTHQIVGYAELRNIDLSSQKCDLHRHVATSSLYAFLSLFSPVVFISASGWAGSDISSYSFLIEAGNVAHCLVCVREYGLKQWGWLQSWFILTEPCCSLVWRANWSW